jgi:hypothetical protein
LYFVFFEMTDSQTNEGQGIRVLDLTEYILSHAELAAQSERDESGNSNTLWFFEDLKSGALNRYKGTYVAYHKGTLCGQSSEKDSLFKQAQNYYGRSNLAVFRVPETPLLFSSSLDDALGDI